MARGMASLLQDVAGAPLSCSCQGALEDFNRGLTAFVTTREKALPWFKEALEKDMNLVMAHSMVVSLQQSA